MKSCLWLDAPCWQLHQMQGSFVLCLVRIRQLGYKTIPTLYVKELVHIILFLELGSEKLSLMITRLWREEQDFNSKTVLNVLVCVCIDFIATIGVNNKLNFFWFYTLPTVVNTKFFRNCFNLPEFRFCQHSVFFFLVWV